MQYTVPMRYVWDNTQEIEEKIKQHKIILLMLDFDGTLCPIASTPEKATMTKEMRQAVEKLSKKKNSFVAIISGRQIKNVKAKVAITNIMYAGNHGLEKEIYGKKIIVTLPEKTKKILQEIKKGLQTIAKKYPGSFIEDKELVVTIYYRNTDKKYIANLEKDIQHVMQYHTETFSVTHGKMFFEMKPTVGVNKGTVVKEFVEKVQQTTKDIPLAFYIGDDTTDEDAFAALPNGITIRVSPTDSSEATYHFINIEEVLRFLIWLNQNK